ncbi:MAG: CPBP family intramembrane metalloprotease [Phycisphaeraceae bacterium]|nr:CPBP family intramembrane metalloprotease [Phycisphaeraceae bacterium]MCB9847084.1 CPBP family intramembrane metalloprotease [Phycisphaeraceae bacterium]
MASEQEQQRGSDERDAGAVAAPPGEGRPLRDPGSRGGATLAWIGIWLVVAFLGLTPVVHTFFPHLFEKPSEGPVEIVHTAPGGPLRLIAKYALGVSQMAPGGEEALLKELDSFAAASPSDQLRVAIVAGALQGHEAGLDRLRSIESMLGGTDAEGHAQEAGPGFAEAMSIVDRALREGVETLDEAQRRSIVESDGWFGELLLVEELQKGDPGYDAVYGNALLVALMLVGALIGLIGVGVIGLALFITAIVLLVNRKVRAGYAPPAPGGSVYLEMFALFLVSFVVLQLAAGVVYGIVGIDLSRWLVWLLFPVMLWPIARGADVNAWRHAVGWHRGKGVLREVGAGIVGYFAGLPIVGIGLVCAIVLSIVVGALVQLVTGGATPPASHPAIDEIGSGGWLGVVSLYLLASVWAPIFEETFFRGAFYHHARGRLGVILSALLVAFVFASIHPQGIGLIPALMGLAVVFAMIREWRGSIIGCMVAHSMHNATLVTVLLLALG